MAKISKERLHIQEKLKVKGDRVAFPLSIYLKIARIAQELNRKAKIERVIEPDEVLYSLQQDGAPEGELFVVRNL